MKAISALSRRALCAALFLALLLPSLSLAQAGLVGAPEPAPSRKPVHALSGVLPTRAPGAEDAAPEDAQDAPLAQTPAPTATPAPVPASAAQEPPPEIAEMIRVAANEVDTTQRKKLGRSNKYTRWYYEDKRTLGWCAVFLDWCANQAGVTPLRLVDAVPMADEAVFYIHEATVPKLQTAYRSTERFTDVPRPGYMVIYGVVGGTSSVHVAMVETVTDLGDGVYDITTLEGNVSNTVKRYCIRYIQNPKKQYQNMRTLPKDEQTRDDAQYKLQSEKWFITGFGVTWK